mgnify:CR=1 FL=1
MPAGPGQIAVFVGEVSLLQLEPVQPPIDADAGASSPLEIFARGDDPGDLQVFNNHAMLHSRTEYQDHADPAEKRLLWRLWLAPPDAPRLPESWRDFFRAVEPGVVRGGIRGHNHDADCQAFDRRQAERLGMRVAA